MRVLNEELISRSEAPCFSSE